MARRNFRKSAGDPFDEDSVSVDSSYVEADSQIFGDIAAIDAQIERIKAVSIFDIVPDPTQPRRAVPSVVREAWDGSPIGVAEMLKVWWGLTQEERGGRPFDIGAHLAGSETERSDEKVRTYTAGPIETAFLTIIDLAASIRRDGLSNPVTVAATDTGYRLETGERRWLAYHLLYAWFDGHEDRPDEQDQWQRIPTRQVKQVNVWRQANENNARADLNAIAKARQWAVLMMDLHGRANFKPFHAFANEQEYYAQAVDLRPPYGKGEQLLNAMGVTSRSALARSRALLRLPDEIWKKGDDLNLPEETLYELARLPEPEAMERFEQIVLGRNNVDAEEVTHAAADVAKDDYAPGTKRHFSRMVRAITKAGRGKHKYNAHALKALRELRDWLDEQEKRIMDFMD